MTQAISFRPKKAHMDLLNSVENKTEFLNHLIESYKIMKLKYEITEWFSDTQNYDHWWINFDNEDYYKLLNKQWI